ncbi:MAG TPA: multicopper oxidase family protein [Microlunatus sp.]
MSGISRRRLLVGAAGAAGVLAVGGLVGCSPPGPPVTPTAEAVRRAEAARRVARQRTVTARLTPQPTTLDLGGRTVPTWAYGNALPGTLIRATAGDQLRVEVSNLLDTSTSVHWHGLALRNDMDGVPGLTQDPIAAGGSFTYEFTVPDPGTYFYHPHSGMQLDRGLYGALIIDDPAEPGDYDTEWVLVLDDWVDGTGRTPDQILTDLMADPGRSGRHGMGDGSMGGMGMAGMGMGGMGTGNMRSGLLGGAGDVDYPHYVINGKIPVAPSTLTAKPGQRVRLRIINAGTDTAFRVALGGHRLTVTHSDGFPVQHHEGDALLIGMGERYDVTVTLRDGVFPLVASAEGKHGQGLAVARTASGPIPPATAHPAELNGQVVLGTELVASEETRLTDKPVDRTHDLVLTGSMAPYRWLLNGKTFPDADPLVVGEGERVRLRFQNMSMMFHPMHLHGHTFGLLGSGVRKDTVIVRPMETIEVDLDANNPGQWAAHCHNLYHAEAGMMTTLAYRH